MRGQYNIIPVTMAAIFHVVVVASLVFAFDFDRRNYPVFPLKLQATLVTEEEITVPPPVARPPPKPAPDPEPLPDNSYHDRLLEQEPQRLVAFSAHQ